MKYVVSTNSFSWRMCTDDYTAGDNEVVLDTLPTLPTENQEDYYYDKDSAAFVCNTTELEETYCDKVDSYLNTLLSKGFTTSGGICLDVNSTSQAQISIIAQYAKACADSVSDLTAYSSGETIAIDDIRTDEYGVAWKASTAGTTSGDTLSEDTGVTWSQDDDYYNWTSEYRKWTDYNNDIQEFDTASSFLSAAKEVIDYCQGQYAVRRTHKTAIRALTTVATIEAYDYTADWLSNDNSAS